MAPDAAAAAALDLVECAAGTEVEADGADECLLLEERARFLVSGGLDELGGTAVDVEAAADAAATAAAARVTEAAGSDARLDVLLGRSESCEALRVVGAGTAVVAARGALTVEALVMWEAAARWLAAARRVRDRVEGGRGAGGAGVGGAVGERFRSVVARASRPLPRVSIRCQGHRLWAESCGARAGTGLRDLVRRCTQCSECAQGGERKYSEKSFD